MAEVPAIPEGLDSLMPPWAQQLSLLTILILIVAAFMRGWVLTRTQADREVEAERRVSDIWKSNYETANQLAEQMTEALDPVLEGQSALLKAVEALQSRQERAEERDRWLRDRRDPG